MTVSQGDFVIKGVNGEFYPCKSDIFAATYEAAAPAAGMNFGRALEATKAGQRISRSGWNGKDMFVYLVPPASYPVQIGAAKTHFGENAMVPYNAYMAIKNVDGTVSTWVPSVNDCLAEDWANVGEPVTSATPPHQQRVVDERTELKDKHAKLSVFILDNPVFVTLPEAEQARLQKQEDLQGHLLAVLDERIDGF